MKFNYSTILSIFLITYSFSSYSQQKEDTLINKDYFTLSLAELMNMEITVASKEAEKVSDAPGMITVYSDKDIEHYGYYTLSDLANVTSGYSKSPVQYGEYGFETRGQSAGGFENDKHLVLIDGIPVNFSRSYKAPAQEELPLFFAKRVEFLKGPGSALYGTSAFYGVINLTSYDSENNQMSVDSKLSFGSLNNSYRAMGRAVVKNDLGASHLMVGYYNQDASQDFVSDKDTSNLKNWNDNNSLFLYFKQSFDNTKLKGFQLGVMNMRRKTGLGEYWGGPNSVFNNLIWNTFLPYVKYDQDINHKLSTQNYLKGSLSTETGTYGGFGVFTPQGGNTSMIEYQRRTFQIEFLSEFKYKFRKNINLIAGVNCDNKKPMMGENSYDAQLISPDSTSKTSTYVFSQASDTEQITTLSAFFQGQFDVKFLKGMKITAGIREDYGFSPTFHYSQLSPRLGLVQKLTNKINLKILVGQALRTPTVKTVGLNAETKQIVQKIKPEDADEIPSNIKAELIRSYEIGITYNDKKINTNFAIFDNSTTNQIVKAQYSDAQNPLNIVKNLDGQTRAYGYEIDFQYVPNERFRLGINNAYAKAYNIGDDKSEKTTFFNRMPIMKTNLLMSYTISEKYPLNIAFVTRHVSAIRNGDGTNSKGYLLFDMNFIFPVIKQLSVEFQVKNLLNKEINDFSYIRVPMPKRYFMLTIATKF